MYNRLTISMSTPAVSASRAALTAGVDMEMVSQSFMAHGPRLLKEGRLTQAAIDEAVRRVLRVKLRAGLFDGPLHG